MQGENGGTAFYYQLARQDGLVADWCSPAPLVRSLAQVPDGDQLLVDDSVHLAAVPEAGLKQVVAAAGLHDWGSQGGRWG